MFRERTVYLVLLGFRFGERDSRKVEIFSDPLVVIPLLSPKYLESVGRQWYVAKQGDASRAGHQLSSLYSTNALLDMLASPRSSDVTSHRSTYLEIDSISAGIGRTIARGPSEI